MSADQPTATTGISRRTLATAAMWSVPVVAAVAAAPAYAVSRNQCYTMTWTSGTLSQTSTGGSYTATTNTVNRQSLPVSVSSSIATGTAAGYSAGGRAYELPLDPKSNVGGIINRNFLAYTAGNQVAVNAQGTEARQSSGFGVPTSSTTSVLVLNQGTKGDNPSTNRASQTLTFTFNDAMIPKSVSFNVYDVTAGKTGDERDQYTDKVSISGGTVSTGTQSGTPKATVSGNTLTGVSMSELGGSNYVPVTVTGLTGKTLTLTYSNSGTVAPSGSSNPLTYNVQYIGIGDVKVCY